MASSRRTELQWAFPFQIEGHGLVASATYDAHVRQLIEQVIFTAPGERVNRPEFGCGLQALVFGAASSEVIAATQALVQGSLQRWLGDVLQVEAVHVEQQESTVQVTIQYVLRRTQQRQVARFIR